MNYRALLQLANESSEQSFVRKLGHWVLAGDRVMQGLITPANSPRIETVLFDPDSMDMQAKDAPQSLTELVYVFYKSPPSSEEVCSFTLGRIYDNDFVMPDYAVSRTQAVIHVLRGTRFRIRSLGGSNPVRVNNAPIEQEVPLREGDVVAFGRLSFTLLAPSGLYLHLKGIQPQLRLRQLVNSLGQANFKQLKEYSVKFNENIFTQIMHRPSLVGSGVFRGYASRVSDLDPEITMGFLADITNGIDVVPFKVLGRSIYPLIHPERFEENGEEILTIGRGLDNDISMADAAISMHHAQIRFGSEGQYFIRDTNSTNGILVNNQVFKGNEKELFDGDKIKIGRHEFTFMFPSTLYHHLVERNRQN
ncbi:MAG: FHA domain-containing protein [Magnetococcales bacterium]|nr:FHA domain-containing protein [Magnetococcales bacterium]